MCKKGAQKDIFKRTNLVNGIRRIVATVLSICVSAGIMAVGAAQPPELLVNYSFNDLVTNAAEAPFAVKSDSYYIKKYDDNEKGIYFDLKEGSAGMEIPVNMTGKFLVAFDILPNGSDFSGSLQIKSSSKTFQAIRFADCNCIRTYDNNTVGCLQAGKLNRVETVFDAATATYNIFVNGRRITSDYYAGSGMPSSVSAIVFNFMSDSGNGGVLIDNINAAISDEPLPSYPKAAWNPEETELDLTPKGPGNAVILKSNFSKSVSGLGLNTNDNRWEIAETEDGEKCLVIEKTNENSSYADVSVSGEQYRHIVLEASIMPADDESYFTMGIMRSDTANFATLIVVDSNSVYVGGRRIAGLTNKEFTKIALAFDTSRMTFRAYANGEEVIDDGTYSLNGTLMLLRMQAPGGDSKCKMYMKEYNIYEGKEPRDISEDSDAPKYDTSVNIFKDYKQSESLVGNNIGLHISSGVLTANGERSILSPAPYVEDGHTMVPVRAVSEAFGLSVNYQEDTKTVEIDNRISFTAEANVMYVDGNEIALETAAEERDDRIFLPLRALCESGLNKQVYYDGTTINAGMVIIGDREFTPPQSEEELQLLNDYLLYYRPSESEILAAFERNNPSHAHPRLHTTPDKLAQLKEEAKTNPLIQGYIDTLIEQADKACEQDMTPFEYDTSSGEINYGKAQTIPAVATGYLLTHDPKYINYVWYVASTYCSWDDWFPDNYLGTSFITSLIAVAYDWMYDGFTEEQRKVIEEGLYKNSLREALLWQYGVKGQKGSWPTGYNNWNEVCNGSAVIMALALMDVYPEEASRVVANALKGLEFSLFYYAPSGGWWEGPLYWAFGTENLVGMLSAMDTALGTTFALDKVGGISDIADYGADVQSSIAAFNYGDSDLVKTNEAFSLWIARHFNKPELTRDLLANTNNGYGILSIYSLLWLDTSALNYEGPQRPLDAYYAGYDQVVTMRDKWGDGTFAAVKGGVETHSHGHMDIGTFVFDAFGERWASDMGRDNYGLDGYWNIGSARWNILRNRAEGHNTLIINPDATGADHTVFAESEITRFETKPRGVISVVDMTNALSDNAESAQRGFFFTDYRKSLVVRDEVELSKTSDIYWLMYTQAKDVVIDGNSVVLTMNGKKLRVDFVTNGRLTLYFEDAKAMEGRPTVSGEADNAEFRRIRAKVTGSGKVNITAKLTPVGIYSTDVKEYDMPIDLWTIPEGDVPQTPEVDSIMADGVPMNDFAPDKYGMTYGYIEGENHIPKITAESGQYRVEVEEAESLNDMTVVKVFSNDESDYYSSYIIGFKGMVRVIDIPGAKTYQVYNITASDQQSGGEKENAFDNNFETRWAAQGRNGVWIQADLGKACEVDRVYLSAWLGAVPNGRKLLFSIETSEDGVNYTEVYKGNTSGKGEDLEPFDFERCNARYIRVNCNGTTTGDWNSILELVAACRN